VLRDLVKSAGNEPLVHTEGWSANLEMLVKASRVARRIESVRFRPQYELRPRESRLSAWRGALSLYRSARVLRAQAVTS
jgi:hypothetical protein